MNYIKHLSGFFDRVAADDCLNPSHITMYLGLFQIWNANRFRNPISIARSELMRLSKVSAKSTYHKCLKDLHQLGYLQYLPSTNPLKGSKVYLFNFQSGGEQVAGRKRPKNGPSAEQVAGPYINSINVSKQVNDLRFTKDDLRFTSGDLRFTRDDLRFTSEEVGVTRDDLRVTRDDLRFTNEEVGDTRDDFRVTSYDLRFTNEEVGVTRDDFRVTSYDLRFTSEEVGVTRDDLRFTSEDLRITNEEVGVRNDVQAVPGSVGEVREFFESNDQTEIEAERFYNYFSSVGWVVGGRRPMKDWQAAARNWILNTKAGKYGTTTKGGGAGHLHTTTVKQYDEPL